MVKKCMYCDNWTKSGTHLCANAPDMSREALWDDLTELLSHPLDGAFDTQADAILALVRERLLEPRTVEAMFNHSRKSYDNQTVRYKAAMTASLDAAGIKSAPNYTAATEDVQK